MDNLSNSDGIITKFINCRLIRNHQIIQDDHLYVRNGKIINPEPLFFDEKLPPDVIINCDGHLISPGFIDLQINGGVCFQWITLINTMTQ